MEATEGREPDALAAAADAIQSAIFETPGWKTAPSIVEIVAIMRRHGLRGPEPVRPDPLGEALNSGDGSYRP